MGIGSIVTVNLIRYSWPTNIFRQREGDAYDKSSGSHTVGKEKNLTIWNYDDM